MEVQANYDDMARLQPLMDVMVSQGMDGHFTGESSVSTQGCAPVVQPPTGITKGNSPATVGAIPGEHLVPHAGVILKTEPNGPAEMNHQPATNAQPLSEDLAGNIGGTAVNGGLGHHQGTVDHPLPDYEQERGTVVESVNTEINGESAVGPPSVETETGPLPRFMVTDQSSVEMKVSTEASQDSAGDSACGSRAENANYAEPVLETDDRTSSAGPDRTVESLAEPIKTVFQSGTCEPDKGVNLGSEVNSVIVSQMETDNPPVPSVLECVGSPDPSDRGVLDGNSVALRMTENISSEPSADAELEYMEVDHQSPSESVSEVMDSLSNAHLTGGPQLQSDAVPSIKAEEGESSRTGTPNSEGAIAPQQAAKKKPKKLESILSSLKSRSLLSPPIPEEAVIPVDEPIPELPPGTVVVTPMDADPQKVRRKKHRKIKKHDRPLNREKLEGMINAATDIKDLCGVTEGIIDLTALEESENEGAPPRTTHEMTGAGTPVMMVSPNLISQQELPQVFPGMAAQQPVQQAVMVGVAQNGSLIANATGNMGLVNSASSQLQFIQRQQQQPATQFQQFQALPAGQNLVIQQGKTAVGPQLLIQGQAQPVILNQIAPGSQMMSPAQISSPVLSAQLQQPRMMAAPPPASSPMVIQQNLPGQPVVLTQPAGSMAIQQPQVPANNKGQPILVLQRGDTLRLDPSGNLVVVAKDDAKAMPPPAIPQAPPPQPVVSNLPLPPLQQMGVPSAGVTITAPGQVPYVVKPVTTVAAVNMPPLHPMPQLAGPVSTAIAPAQPSTVTSLLQSNKPLPPPLPVMYIPPNSRSQPSAPLPPATHAMVIQGGKQAKMVATPGVTLQSLNTAAAPTYAVNLQSGVSAPVSEIPTPQGVGSTPTDSNKPDGILAEALNAPQSAYLDSASGLHLAASGLVQQNDLPNNQGQALLAKLAQPQIMQAITNAANSVRSSGPPGTPGSQQGPKQIRIVYRSSQSNPAKAGTPIEPKKVTLFSCSVCTKIFLRRDSYQQHLITHYSSHPCPHCPRRCINATELAEHVRVCPKRHRTKLKPPGTTHSFSCGHCGEKFHLSKDLTPHTRVAHRGLPIKAMYHTVINTSSGQTINSTPISIHEATSVPDKKRTLNNILKANPELASPASKPSVPEKRVVIQPVMPTPKPATPPTVASVSGIHMSTIIKREKDMERPFEKPKSPRRMSEPDGDWVLPPKTKRRYRKLKVKKVKHVKHVKQGKRLPRRSPGGGDKVIPKYLLVDEVQPGFPKTEKVNPGDDYYGGILIQKDPECTSSILLKQYGDQKKSKGSRPFICKLCPKDFFSKHCLFEHIKIHVKPFTCGECGLQNARKDNIMRHIQLVHQGPKYKTRDKRKSGFGEERAGKRSKLNSSSSSSGNAYEGGAAGNISESDELPTMVKKPSRVERMERRNAGWTSGEEQPDDVIEQLTCEKPGSGVTGSGNVASDGNDDNVSDEVKNGDDVNDDGNSHGGDDVNRGQNRDGVDGLVGSTEHVMSPAAGVSDVDHQYAATKDAKNPEDQEGDMVDVVGEINTDGEGDAENAEGDRVVLNGGDSVEKAAPPAETETPDDTTLPESNEGTLNEGRQNDSLAGLPDTESGGTSPNNNDKSTLPPPAEEPKPDRSSDDAIEKIDDSVMGASGDGAFGEDDGKGTVDMPATDVVEGAATERSDSLSPSSVTVSTLFCSEEGNIDEGEDDDGGVDIGGIDPTANDASLSMPTDVIEIVLSETDEDLDPNGGSGEERSVIPHIVSVRSLTEEQLSEPDEELLNGPPQTPVSEQCDGLLNDQRQEVTAKVNSEQTENPDTVDRIKGDTLVPIYSPSGSTVLGYKEGPSGVVKEEAKPPAPPATTAMPSTTVMPSVTTMPSTTTMPPMLSNHNPYIMNHMRPSFQRPISPRMSSHSAFFPGLQGPPRGMFPGIPSFMGNPYLRQPPSYPGMGFLPPSLRGLASMRPPGAEFMEKHASMMRTRMPYMSGRMPFPMQPREGVAVSHYPGNTWMSPFYPRSPVWVQQPSVSPSVATSPLDLSNPAKSPKGASTSPLEPAREKEKIVGPQENTDPLKSVSPGAPSEPQMPKLIRGEELGKYRTKNGFLPNIGDNRQSPKTSPSPSSDAQACSPVLEPTILGQPALPGFASGPMQQGMDFGGPIPVHRFPASQKPQMTGFYPPNPFQPPRSSVHPMAHHRSPQHGPLPRLPYHRQRMPKRNSPRLDQMARMKPYPSWRPPQPGDLPPFPRKRFRRSPVRHSSTGDSLSSSSSSSSPCKRSPRRRASAGDRPFKCPITPCRKAFKRPHYLQEHISNHAKAGEIDSSNLVSPPISRKIKTLVSSPNGEVEVEVDLERPFICHICSKGFKRKNNLADHVRTHSRPYKCGECSFDTIRWQYLAEHMKKAHNFQGDEKELEALFKQSGKKLKPTDIIPLSAMTPITERIKNGRLQDMAGVYMWRSMRISQSKSKRMRTLKTMKRRKRRRNKNDLVDFYGNSDVYPGESSTQSGGSVSTSPPRGANAATSVPDMLPDGIPYEDDGFIADDSVSQESEEDVFASSDAAQEKTSLDIKKEMVDATLSDGVSLVCESNRADRRVVESVETPPEDITVLSSDAENAGHSSEVPNRELGSNTDFQTEEAIDGSPMSEERHDLMDHHLSHLDGDHQQLHHEESGSTFDNSVAPYRPVETATPTSGNASVANEASATSVRLPVVGTSSTEAISRNLDVSMDDGDSIDELLDPQLHTKDGMQQESKEGDSVPRDDGTIPSISCEENTTVGTEMMPANQISQSNTDEFPAGPSTSIEPQQSFENDSLEDVFNDESRGKGLESEPVVVACVGSPQAREGGQEPNPVEDEVNNNWLFGGASTSNFNLHDSSTSGASGTLDSSTLTTASAGAAPQIASTLEDGHKKKRRKKKKGKHRWSRVKHRSSSYSPKSLTGLEGTPKKKRGRKKRQENVVHAPPGMPSVSSSLQAGEPTFHQATPARASFCPSGALFASPLNLEQYFYVDEGIPDRPFRCTIDGCDKGFKNKQHMREHIFTHIKPYKCDICGVGFPRTDYLALHMKDEHKLTPTKKDLFEKRKLANDRAMACRRRKTNNAKRKALYEKML